MDKSGKKRNRVSKDNYTPSFKTLKRNAEASPRDGFDASPTSSRKSRGDHNPIGDDRLGNKEEEAPKDGFGGGYGGGYASESKAATGSDQVGRGFRKESGKKSTVKGKSSKSKMFTKAGVAGFVVFVIMALFSIFQGPLETIHLAQIMQKFHFGNNESFGDGRSGKLLRYLWNHGDPNRNNLGTLGNFSANRYETRLRNMGVDMKFDHPTKNGKRVRRIQSITIDTNNPNSNRMIQGLLDEGVDLNPDTNSKVSKTGDVIRIDLRGEGGTKLGKNVVKGSVRGGGLNKVSGALAKRLLIRRAKIDMHPLRNRIYERSQESKDAYRKRIQKEDADKVKNGSKSPNTRVRGGRQTDPDTGETTGDTTDDSDRANQEVDRAADMDADGAKSHFSKVLSRGGAAGAAIGMMCMAKSMSDQVEEIQHENIIVPLIRLGMMTVSTGNQIMTGQDMNIDELGAVSALLYDEEDQTSWADARSIKYENGRAPIGPDINEEAKPAEVGDKPDYMKWTDSEPVEKTCDGWDKIGQLPVIKQVGEFFDKGIDAMLGTIGTSQDELARNFAGLFAGQQVDALAEGALRGNYINYGSRLAANDGAIAQGGRELSDEEVKSNDLRAQFEQKTDFQSQNMFARYFDIYDHRSVAGTAVMSVPSSVPQSLASLFRSPGNLFSMFTGTVNAQEEEDYDYEYGFSEYGFSQEEQGHDFFENPLENADLMEEGDRLEKLNKRYGGGQNDNDTPCFGLTINTEGNIVNGTEVMRYDQIAQNDENGYKDGDGIPDCEEKGDQFPDGSYELDRYRFYIADMVAAHTLACYEGKEDSCEQLFQAGDGSSSEDQSANPNMYVIGDSLTVGMRDSGGLQSKLEEKGWQITDIEANSGDTIASATPRISENESRLRDKGGTVIVALGTNNDPNNQSAASDQIGELVQEVRRINSSITIKWVNTYTKKSEYNGVNAAIDERASSLNYSVIDWRTEAKNNPDAYPFAPDGIHHTADGYDAKATYVVNGTGVPTAPGSGSAGPAPGEDLGGGYYRMPPAPNNEYIFASNTPDEHRCGSKKLVDILYDIGIKWHQRYPNSRLNIGDLNATGHKSHKNGIDVDIGTEDRSAAHMSGNAEKSKEMGRLFADTGVIKYIFYNDSSVQNDFNNYVQQKGLPGRMQHEPGHADHFHVRILEDYRLETRTSCP